MIVAILFMIINGNPVVIDNIASARECETLRLEFQHKYRSEFDKSGKGGFWGQCLVVEKAR